MGYTTEEKFWNELDEEVQKIPGAVVIGADLNGHMGEGNTDESDGKVWSQRKK